MKYKMRGISEISSIFYTVFVKLADFLECNRVYKNIFIKIFLEKKRRRKESTLCMIHLTLIKFTLFARKFTVMTSSSM